MTEHFLNYEQSLAVKELGFPQNNYLGWFDSRNILYLDYDYENESYIKTCCAAPLKSQFFKWVREKYLLIGYASTGFCPFKDEPKSKSGYRGFIKGVDIRRLSSSDKFFKEIETTCFKTYEEAEDACINKIIELLKLK